MPHASTINDKDIVVLCEQLTFAGFVRLPLRIRNSKRPLRTALFLFAPNTFLISGISVIGSALRSTISPVLARAMLLGLVKRVFQLAAVPDRFDLCSRRC
jgi:hypothetical protein